MIRILNAKSNSLELIKNIQVLLTFEKINNNEYYTIHEGKMHNTVQNSGK